MNTTIYKFRFLSGFIALVVALAFVIVLLLQLAGVSSFLVDKILIYTTSLCIVIHFVPEILAPHYVTPEEKKFWGHAAWFLLPSMQSL